MSTRSDQRPGGAATARARIQRVRASRRRGCVEESGSATGASSPRRPGKTADVRVVIVSDPLKASILLPMASHNEVEIKFRVDDVRALNRRLRKSGFRLITRRTREMNTLYDLPGQLLRQRGELLRLRKYGSDWLLTHKAKGKAGRHKTRVENETKSRRRPEDGSHLARSPIFPNLSL